MEIHFISFAMKCDFSRPFSASLSIADTTFAAIAFRPCAFRLVEECTHLGIKRDSVSNTGHSTTVEDRIKSARGCAYSLMGAGLHGENGGNPRVSLSLWNTYVLPRLTYGLDVLTLSNSEIQKLNQFHKRFLKQVMHLHERTADAAVYILSGQLPLVADLHKRVLGTLGSVLRSNSIERELAERQIQLKDKKSKSWFVYVGPILSQYNLPSTIDLLRIFMWTIWRGD